jgi:hypothetical protein
MLILQNTEPLYFEEAQRIRVVLDLLPKISYFCLYKVRVSKGTGSTQATADRTPLHNSELVRCFLIVWVRLT